MCHISHFTGYLQRVPLLGSFRQLAKLSKIVNDFAFDCRRNIGKAHLLS